MIELPKMKRYEDLRSLSLDVPETYNFAFDVIDARAIQADKTAFISVDRSGERIERHKFSDLSRASNRFANVLLALGARKGDFALVVIPRIPAWYEVLIGSMKVGVVSMPGTNFLTAKDIASRWVLNRPDAAIV